VRYIKALKLTTLAILFSFLLVSPVFAATVTIENVEETATGKKLTVFATLNRTTEHTLVIRRISADGRKWDKEVTPMFIDDNGDGEYNEMRFRPFLENSDNLSKVEFYVKTKDKRLVKVNEYTGGTAPPANTVNPPALQTTVNEGGLEVNTGIPNLPVTIQDANQNEVYNGTSGNDASVYIPYANNTTNSQMGFTWEFFNGHHIRYDWDYHGVEESEEELGTMENGVFVPLGNGYDGSCWASDDECETQYEPNAPDGGYYMRITIPDGNGNTETYIFDTNGIVNDGGDEPPAYPLKVTVQDEQGNPYEYTVNQDGTATPTNGEIAAESYPVEEDGTGGTGGTGDTGGTGGTTCTGCELLQCPGWDAIAEKIGSAVGSQLPGPPNWDELENMLGHPAPPPEIETPTVPTFDGKSGITLPEAQDSTPPARDITFDTVPDIQVNEDNTGGIDLTKADPIDSLPHDPEDYTPIPGNETGGDKPQTKEIDTPLPSNNNTEPPAEDQPTPGTTTEDSPSPGGSTSPPPAPEMPMP